MEDIDPYNWKYLELEHRTGYKQLYPLSERVSVNLVHDAAKQLKMRWAEAWAKLMRGEDLAFRNSIFRLTK